MIGEDIIGVPPSLLNFSYKIFIGKHVLDIVLLNLPNFDEFGMTIGESVPEVPSMSGPFRGHLFYVLM